MSEEIQCDELDEDALDRAWAGLASELGRPRKRRRLSGIVSEIDYLTTTTFGNFIQQVGDQTTVTGLVLPMRVTLGASR
jgi:hypothetical protein